MKALKQTKVTLNIPKKGQKAIFIIHVALKPRMTTPFSRGPAIFSLIMLHNITK